MDVTRFIATQSARCIALLSQPPCCSDALQSPNSTNPTSHARGSGAMAQIIQSSVKRTAIASALSPTSRPIPGTAFSAHILRPSILSTLGAKPVGAVVKSCVPSQVGTLVPTQTCEGSAWPVIDSLDIL